MSESNTNLADWVGIPHLLKLFSENDMLALVDECGQGINSKLVFFIINFNTST